MFAKSFLFGNDFPRGDMAQGLLAHLGRGPLWHIFTCYHLFSSLSSLGGIYPLSSRIQAFILCASICVNTPNNTVIHTSFGISSPLVHKHHMVITNRDFECYITSAEKTLTTQKYLLIDNTLEQRCDKCIVICEELRL